MQRTSKSTTGNSKSSKEPPLERALDTSLGALVNSIKRPFDLASKDDFNRLEMIKGLEGLVVTLSAEAMLASDGKVSASFSELKTLFTGFEEKNPLLKRDCIIKGDKILDDIAIIVKKTQIKGKSPDISVKKTKKLPQSKTISSKTTERRPKGVKEPILNLKGIGPALSARLEKRGIKSIEDLLYQLPIRYEDRRNIKRIKELIVGSSEVTRGEIVASGEARYGRRRVFEAAISDGSGILLAKWFNYRRPYMEKLYKAGRELIIYGPVTRFGAKKEIIHPEVEFTDDDLKEEPSEPPGVVPVYSQIDNLHQKTIRKFINSAVTGYASAFRGVAPKDILAKHSLMELPEALSEIHKVGPSRLSPAEPSARRSLVFDELFSLEIGLALRREAIEREPGREFTIDGGAEGFSATFLRSLPFSLTGAQEAAWSEIKSDMRSPHPMNRLIQGDVGSGKTVVSLLAVLAAIENGYQAAIMAPTEILAEQHYLTATKLTEALTIPTALLKGSGKGKAKTLADIASGSVKLIIGTHALIQKSVDFHKLGLVVIDEQHRFGVLQRAALKNKAGQVAPDILIMTATPIPRTLTMTVFGDMEVSVIGELPPGRSPVETLLLREKERERAYLAIRREVQAGGQAYIVYPLVEESEELPLRDATRMKEHLESDIFPELTLALIHGRMKGDEKREVMAAFKDGTVDILVSTTVIEVGVDVPNASIMLIEHAERFGLAALHQLRGRVGRGTRASKCLLLAQWTGSEDALKRLKVMVETGDGFKIAEEDLKIRGPGDFLGSRQSGLPDFRLSETLADLTLLKTAREEAFSFLKRAARATPERDRVVALVRERWSGRLELADIG